MNIACFMPVRNEADILEWTLRALFREGVSAVHALDGWSTDGTYEILRSYPRVTVQRWPPERDDGVWSCERTLEKIEKMAAASCANWCMLSDADEIRVSNFADRLVDQVILADKRGDNVIDHVVGSFQPVDDGWNFTKNPEEYFRFYTQDPAIDGVCKPAQEKLWKNNLLVDIHSSGGHTLYRPDKRLSPVSLVMKHYPFRNSIQARAKLEDRIARRDHREHHDYGWGVHYDSLIEKRDFIQPVERLHQWET
jgi:hypothetical protein